MNNSDIKGRRLFYNNQVFKALKPVGNGISKWIIQSGSNYYTINTSDMLILIEDFEMRSKDNSEEKPKTVLDKVQEAIKLKNQLDTNKLILELSDREIEFMLTWIATGISHSNIIKSIKLSEEDL